MSNFNEKSANFALNLMHNVAKDNENVFFSPLSINLALAMCYAGSHGNTKLQMQKHLFGGVDDLEIQNSFNKIVTALNQPNDQIKLSTANRLYSQNNFQILQTYRDLLEKTYHSGIFSVDFRSNGEKVRKEINDWVAQTTNDKIKDLIPADAFDDRTRLVLVNALYFKAEWANKFEKESTTKQSFHVSASKSIDVDMMRQSDRFNYGENDKCQVLSMPYTTYSVNMVVILPKDKFGLTKLEKEMTGASLLELLKSVSNKKVNVQLPKMKLEQTFTLNEPLKAIGVTDAFDENKADFVQITGKRDLFISDVLHKAFVEVNEDGTEAAAATAVMMALCGAIMDPNPPKDFVADHPFMFAIVSSEDKTLLFLGHYYGSSS